MVKAAIPPGARPYHLSTGKRHGFRMPHAHQAGADYVRICDIEKMIRRGGGVRSTAAFKHSSQKLIENLFKELISLALTCKEHRRRKTLEVRDVQEATHIMGLTLYH